AEDAHTDMERSFVHQAGELNTTLNNAIAGYTQILRSAAGFISASEEVTLAEWKRYYLLEQLEKNYPGLQGLGYAAFLRTADIPAFVARQRAAGRSSYAVSPLDRGDFHVPVTFIEPENERNLRAVGFDMYSETTRRAALDTAMMSGQAAATSAIRLAQETPGTQQPGILLYFPVYKRDMPTQTDEQKRKTLAGYVFEPIRTHDMFDKVLGARADWAEVRIWQGTRKGSGNILFASDGAQRPVPLYVYEGAIDVHNESWLIELRSTP